MVCMVVQFLLNLENLTRLVYLDLSDQGYHGSLPSELGNLSNLQYIYLSNNAFTGSIPSEFGNLLKLEILSLRDNLLSGFIPPELGRLNLEYLDIRNNGFSGSIPQEILNNNISKFFHDNYNDKNKQVVEKEEKNDLNKDAKSDNGTNPFLIIAIVFGIISIILTILIFLVLRKNRDLKKKNNERIAFLL
ncbi:L domain-like protein [Piromyces finnis]|uniref:L domain-like protein n=1 Tax=Piromyces finnis TaxID=1754191 RepID=A0A1Y1UW37_9FUNG|nr:L domain-like protein [Piromyces finnis]|eukprot:ORX42297.1 L domain-like protein [Piromyces finnis]